MTRGRSTPCGGASRRRFTAELASRYDAEGRPACASRPLPAPRPGLAGLLPGLGHVCSDLRRHHAGGSRPRPHDRGKQDLVGELSTQNETFRALWGAHDARSHYTGTKRFHHPDVGELILAYVELAITAEPGLILMIYTGAPRITLRRAARNPRLPDGQPERRSAQRLNQRAMVCGCNA